VVGSAAFFLTERGSGEIENPDQFAVSITLPGMPDAPIEDEDDDEDEDD